MTTNYEILKTGPYSADEARALCEKYSSLKGTTIYADSGKEEIEYVEIAPYDKVNKWMFFHSFMERSLSDYSKSLRSTQDFDIVVITRQCSKRGRPFYVCKDLRDALANLAKVQAKAI